MGKTFLNSLQTQPRSGDMFLKRQPAYMRYALL